MLSFDDSVLRPAACDGDDAGEDPMGELKAGLDEEEVGRLGCWSVSSAKPGFGVELLRDGHSATFWQSDGNAPHTISIHFRRLTHVTRVGLLLNGAEDDSYTPEVVSVSVGCTAADLQTVSTKTLDLPTGWVVFKLADSGRGGGRRSAGGVPAHTVRVAVHENHNSGKDVHVRRVAVFGRRQPGLVDPAASDALTMHAVFR